ncbi:MAG: PAS domain-containing protein, partial [Deltaproteobacteria bacterium]|nr:PAS domain-containing protein [Deltaproteobacteria bacterium]
MSKIQLKIMCALALLIAVVVGVSGILAERGLRNRTTTSIESNLEQQAQLVRQLVADVGFERVNAARLQEIARAGSVAAGARITLIDASGRVLADSEVPPSEIPGLSNHADRPEVIDAVRTGVGQRMRRSDTLRRTLLYVAVRVPETDAKGGPGIVRLAVYLDQLDAAAAELRSELFVAGAIGLLGALGFSYALSLLSLRPIKQLLEVVTDIAAGKLESRLRWESRDERGEIADSINRLARQMRQRADDALREKVRLEAVLKGMVEGVLVVDREGKVLLANPRAQEMLAVWGEFEGRLVPEVIRSPEVDQALQDAASSDGTVVREMEVQAEKKRVLLMHASGFPEADPRAGTVAVFHDVSELRRVDAVRRDFIANASHELRTPLTAIQGFADTLASSEVGPEQHAKYLDVIVRNARRMSSLIDDLLTLSRIESGTSPLEVGPVDLVRVTEALIADFGPRFQEAGIEIELHAGQISPCRADRGALEQILSNLLSNAARYSNPGSRVDIFLDQRDGHVEVRVVDTGIGIPAQDLERIFERFYRVDAARSRAVGSTGLGLSIVKHLVRAMDGEIDVESE